MINARNAVLAEVRQIIAETGLRPSQLAKAAGVASTTLTRFLREPESAALLSNTTMGKLRDARDRLRLQRQLPPDIQRLTDDTHKRALIARVLTLSPDAVGRLERALEEAASAPPARRKPDDAA